MNINLDLADLEVTPQDRRADRVSELSLRPARRGHEPTTNPEPELQNPLSGACQMHTNTPTYTSHTATHLRKAISGTTGC